MPPPRARPPRPIAPDPLVPAPGPPAAAPALGSGAAVFERGTVLEVDARRHAYRVVLNSGRVVAMGRVRSSPGDTALLRAGTPVLVSFALGAPYILGVLPPEVAHVEDPETTLTDTTDFGGADSALDRGLPVTGRDPTSPDDLLPGDAALQGPDGAHVGALAGRVATLTGGPLARIVALGDEDRIRVFAGEFRLDTWMGFSEVVNEDGKTSFRWRGGTDQLTQTGPDEERYTLALDVGHSGDVLRFELTNRSGQALFRVHVDGTGRAEVFAAGGVVGVSGDGPNVTHETARHGNDIQTVTGDHTLTVGGTYRQVVARRWNVGTGGPAELIAGGFVNLVATEGASVQAGGELLLRAARLARLRGNSITCDPQTGVFTVETVRTDAVVLGTNATSHGTKYEELVQGLTQLTNRVNELSRTFATHSHPASPVTDPAIPNPAYFLYTTPVTINWTTARATVVKIK